ncbi:MAG: MBL fold metallo-hydrolase RNA specificity domain-containing protein [Acutalibacteraceae bacterium]
MKVTFIGADHEVTGSCTLLEACGKRILIDCGMEQGPDIYENCDLPVAPGEIDAICLTHAHIDHSGKIPFMVANGYLGPIHATGATCKLCNIMLRDSAHIQELEEEWRNRKAARSGGEKYVPLYTMQDVEKTLPLFVAHRYGEDIEIFDGISIRFYDAGHLLGSACILFTLNEDGKTKTILFSGDLGNTQRPLLRDTETPPRADYAVVESTYGDRTHEKRVDYVSQLTEIIDDTFSRGGNVVIPSFAVGRTQELLYILRIIKENGILAKYGDFPVYVDSPLANEATHIYSSEMSEYFDEETLKLLKEGINPISFPNLRLSITSNDSKAINEDKVPKIIISASGMCEAGRIRHHLKHNLWREDSTVLFVGYQSEGTLGNKLLGGAKKVKLFGEEVAVRARIAKIQGISSHADRRMLFKWIQATGCRQLFVNHGEDSVCEEFANSVEKELNIPAVAPFTGDVYDLLTGIRIETKPIVRVISKQNLKTQRNNAVYERLLAAGRRLMALIERKKGYPNKELSRLADQINSLCDKNED